MTPHPSTPVLTNPSIVLSIMKIMNKIVDKHLTDSAMKPGRFMIPHSCLFHMQGRFLFIDQPFLITWCSGRNKAISNSMRVKEMVNLWIKLAKLGH